MAHSVLIRLTAMGDVLLAIPAARALKDTRLHWVLSRRWADLAPFLPARVHLVSSPADLLRTARQLRALAPEQVFDLQGKLSSRLLSWLLPGHHERLQKRSLAESWAVTCRRFPLVFADRRPVWQKYLATVQAPPEAFADPDPRLELSSACLAESRAFLRQHDLPERRFVLFHPQASHPGKCLPPAAIAAFAETFSRKFAGKGAGQAAKSLVFMGEGALPDASYEGVKLTNQIPLRLLPGVMSLSAGVISSDSGPMHLARACGVPLAGIFLQTAPSLGFSPIPGPGVQVFSRPLPCKPCSLHGQRTPCPIGTWECRNWNWEVLADEVFESFAARSAV
jgi:ADP-heptose:LPS heptosyltransferase